MVDNPTKIYNDYVRANLPNGMSYDTGTDRYDINNHSFFKFKNSNWYYNYISKYGYSALSAYAVNELEPALVFDFKNDYYRKVATDSTFPASITHTASTNATMVDSDGLLKWRPHNNITKSNTFSTWTKSNSTVVDNAVDGPTGIANTASTVNFNSVGSHIYNLSTVAVSAGDKVTLAAWVRSDTITSITFAVNGRTQAANNTPEANLTVTSAWTLVTFEATVPVNDTGLWFLIGKHNPASPVAQIGEFEMYGVHMYRSDLGGMVNNSEQPTGFGTYVPTTTTVVYGPRVGHHIYNGTAWVNEGILHESEARTNLVTYSEDFTDASWLKVSSTITANIETAPDGTLTADRLTETSSYAELRSSSIGSVGGAYTASVWLKAGTGDRLANNVTIRNLSDGVNPISIDVNLTDGSFTYVSGSGGGAVTESGNGWWRISITADLASGKVFRVSTGSGLAGSFGESILVWGAQIEAGSTASSYIPTAGAAATRAADLLTVPAANLPYDNTNMSIQIDGKMTGDTLTPVQWLLDASNSILLESGSNNFSFTQKAVGTVDTVTGGSFTSGTNVPFNLASRHGSTFINGAVDGTALTADTTPTALPNLASSNLILGDTFMGTIGQFRMWSDDLTDAGIAEAST